MSDGEAYADGSDLRLVTTRQDFGRALTRVRERAGLTIRDVARAVDVPTTTVGDYFGGAHLPPLGHPGLLTKILVACGVDDPVVVAQWQEVLRRVRRPPGPRPGSGAVPYRGLAAYEPGDAEWFFGREQLTKLLLDRLLLQRPDAGGPLVVVGPSGSGKSSLLRAGLIPSLRGADHGASDTREWAVLLCTPGIHPMTMLRERLAEVGAVADAGGLLLVVDQFEEVFTSCPDQSERQAFITEVCMMAGTATGDAGVTVVLGLRADFYAEALRDPLLARAMQHRQVVVEPMSQAQVRRAIIKPAAKAKLNLEDGLVELLLRDLAPIGADSVLVAHDPGGLPLLSHALLATWQGSQRGRMTVAAYREAGGIGGAVARTADDVFDTLPDTQRDLARRILLRLVNVTDDAPDTRRRLTPGELSLDHGSADPHQVRQVIDAFVEARLLTLDADTVEITHEALIRAWPLLRKWVDADRAGLRAAGALREAAQTWNREHRDPAALYRGARLAAAREWADASHRDELSPLTQTFLDASIHRERRRTRRVRQAVGALAALTALTASAGIVAVEQRAVTQRQRTAATVERNLAISRMVAGRADRVRGNDVSLAKQLALAAYQIAPTVEARSSLLDTSATPTAVRMLGATGTVHAVAYSPDRKLLATGSADHTIRLWDVTDPHRPHPLGPPLTGSADRVTTLAFGPDGRTLATSGVDAKVRLWDLSDPNHPTATGDPLLEATDVVNSVAISPDGRTLAAASTDHGVHLWDLSTTRHPAPLGPPLPLAAAVNAVAFSPDGRTLAAAGDDLAVHRWDVTNPAHPRSTGPLLTGAVGALNTVAFSPDGRTLAAAGQDQSVRLWNLTDPQHPAPARAPLTGPASWVYAVTFSPDGRAVAAASADNAVRVWDLTSGQVTATLPHPGPVTAVAYGRGGATVATGAADGTTRLWMLPTPVLTDPAGSVFTVAFSPDGHTLGAASGDRTVRLWNLTDPARPANLDPPLTASGGNGDLDGTLTFGPGGRLAAGRDDGAVQVWDATDPAHPQPEPTPPTALTGSIQSVTYTADGSILAAGDSTGGVQLWNVTDRHHPTSLATLTTTHGQDTFSVAFSPDGRTLAAASADQSVWLWDITTPSRPIPRHTRLTGATNAVYHVLFSPKGHTLAAASADGTVRLWDVVDPDRPVALGPPLTGPKGYVYAVAFTPDGRTLATADTDKTVWLWDVSDPKRPHQTATLSGPTDAVFTVAFNPDGHTLASGSQDHTVRLWNTDPDHVTNAICADQGTPITPAEWHQYIPGPTYDQPCPP